MSLLHSLVFMLDEDPHFALFYTLDLLRAFFKIQPEPSLAFFASKFGPVVLKEHPDKAPGTFSVLLSNFSSLLEVFFICRFLLICNVVIKLLQAKEDIVFVMKDGKYMVQAASIDR